MSGWQLAFDLYTLSPVGYDEDLWEDADLPPDRPRAYLLGFEGESDSRSWQDEQIGYDLLRGLARRLDGRCRPNVEMAWDALSGEPADPWVYAPRTLSPEEALDLLAPHLVDASIVSRADSGEYRIDADGLIMWCDPLTPTPYPHVKARSWYDTARDVAEYQFVSDPAAGGPERADTAARILAAEAGGIVLDEDGFSWP
jgi:hypothetical protein